MKDQHQFTAAARRRQRGNRPEYNALCAFPLSFGCYRDVPLSSVPKSYLHWVLIAEGIPDDDRWAVEQYLQTVEAHRRGRPGRRRSRQRHREVSRPAVDAVDLESGECD